jgi:hypothetical protein
MKPRTKPGHMRIKDVAARLAHSERWVRERIARGELVAYRWSRVDVTVSVESVEHLERMACINPPSAPPGG